MSTPPIQVCYQELADALHAQPTPGLIQRLELLRALAAALRDHEEPILQALKDDLHKSNSEAFFCELDQVHRAIAHARRHLARWMRRQRGRMVSIYPGAFPYQLAEPYGLVLIMAPWNYPVDLTLAPLVDAIAAGNRVLLAPSPKAAHTHAALFEMLEQALPHEYVRCIAPGAPDRDLLLTLHFDYVLYTGGASYGRQVALAAAQHLTPCTLELGGKSPVIVGPAADVDSSARRIVWGKCLNAGQTCVAPDYVLVAEGLAQPLIAALIREFVSAFGPEPEASPDYPRIITQAATQRLQQLLVGQPVVYGGDTKVAARYVSPTLVYAPALDAPLMQEEIFGPILPIVPYRTLAEALSIVRARPKPLALYHFGSKSEFQKILSCTSSGGACHNDVVIHITHPALPFGGVGASGYGRYHGRAGFLTFSNLRSVLNAHYMPDMRLRHAPYAPLARIKRLLRWV